MSIRRPELTVADQRTILARKIVELVDAVNDLLAAPACSVVGRSVNRAGEVADIEASANGQYLGRRSDAVAFLSIALGDLPSTVVRGGGNGVANRLAYFSDSNTLTSDADGTFDGTDLTIGNRINTSNPGTTLQTALGVRVNVGGTQTTPRVMMGPTENVGATYHFLTARGRNGAGAVTLNGAAVGDVVKFGQGMQLGLEGDGLTGQFETTISVVNQIQQTSTSNLTTLNFLFVLERRSATGATTERPLYVVP